MRAFGIASLSSTALYVGGKCRKPGTKKAFVLTLFLCTRREMTRRQGQ